MPGDWKSRARKIEDVPAPVAAEVPEAPELAAAQAPESATTLAAPAPGGSWKDRARRIEEPPGLGESALRGGAQGLTLGFADEGQAAARAIANPQPFESIEVPSAALEDPSTPTRPIGKPESFSERYRSYRDPYRARDEAAAAEHPGAFYGAELAGGAAVPLGAVGLGGRAAATGASLGARALAGAAAAAPVGAIAGLGHSKADLTQGEVGKAALDTALGAGTAAAVGAALPVAGEILRGTGRAVRSAAGSALDAASQLPGVRSATTMVRAAGRSLARAGDPDVIEARAGQQAIKAFGGQGVSALKHIGDAESQEQLGVWALRQGLINDDPAEAAIARPELQQRTAAMVKQAGEDIGQIRRWVQEAGYGPEARELRAGINQIVRDLDVKGYEAFPEAQKVLGLAEQAKAAIKANTQKDGRVSPEFLDVAKSWIDRQLESFYANPGQETPEAAVDLRRGIRNLFRIEEEKSVAQLGQGFEINGQTALERFLEAKPQYGNGLDLLRVTGVQNRRDLANLGLGLREAGLLGMATMSGSPLTGVATIAAKRLGDEYGNATAALALLRRADAARAAQAAQAGAAVAPAAGVPPPQISRAAGGWGRTPINWGTQAIPAAASALPSSARQILDRALGSGSQKAAAAAAMFLIRQNPELRDQIIRYVEGFGEGPEPQVQPALR
jgi:hypothetical protein